MTNGAFIFFKNRNNLEDSVKILNNYKFFGLNVFSVKKVSEKSIFYKFKIKFFRENFEFESFNKKTINKIVNYDISEKVKFNKEFSKQKFLEFISQIHLIKTTGVHSSEGILFYDNFNIKDKNIHNHQIFNLIKNFF